MLYGGVQLNVVPDELKVGFDMRVTPSKKEEADKLLAQWCEECDVTIEWHHVSHLLIFLCKKHGLFKLTLPSLTINSCVIACECSSHVPALVCTGANHWLAFYKLLLLID